MSQSFEEFLLEKKKSSPWHPEFTYSYWFDEILRKDELFQYANEWRTSNAGDREKELEEALKDMVNYYKPGKWVDLSTGFEVLNKAIKVLSKNQGGG